MSVHRYQVFVYNVPSCLCLVDGVLTCLCVCEVRNTLFRAKGEIITDVMLLFRISIEMDIQALLHRLE